MPAELLATCWTHAGDALPVPGRHLSPLDLRARAEAVAAAGFVGIGFTLEDLQAAGARYPLRDVGAICADLGLRHLEVELLQDWWTTGEPRRASDRTRVGLLEAAGALGARQMKIGPGTAGPDGVPPGPVDPARRAAALHELAGQAAGVGTRVALEPLPFSDIADFRVAADLVAAADHPAAGLVVDIWHLEHGPSDLGDLAAIPVGTVFAVEIDDAPALASTDLFHETIHRRVLPGAGTFDVRGFVGTLQRMGYPGPWGVEIISEAHRSRPPADTLREVHRSVTAVFDALADTGA
ncbi:sugar phosphate isomerase/epimerase [Nakamurella flavida]|uniref:sugar phosphate isomerase/epimerase family protein n=1 Tax=Nakamurella flavida TaxID=363630 RepID=UPI00277EA12C|nr:TIM barrel protein [Nakamurella flavida]MDP9777608.1 sugar phosphate isomerase/epimerase [Nakamurella flavida]